MPSQVLLEGSAQEYMHASAGHEESEVDEDPESPLPLPKKIRMRKSRRNNSRRSGSRLRVVQYQGGGSIIGTPIDLPFAPPGLMWRGEPAITTSQLFSLSRKKAPDRRGRGRE